MTSRDPFRLKKVCGNCPFRCDVPFMGLSASRVAEIADSLRAGGAFYCHKTLDYDDDDQALTGHAQMCAGAMATMEKGHEPNQIMRIAERLGIYAPEEFAGHEQPVHAGLDEWQDVLTARDMGDEETGQSEVRQS